MYSPFIPRQINGKTPKGLSVSDAPVNPAFPNNDSVTEYASREMGLI